MVGGRGPKFTEGGGVSVLSVFSVAIWGSVGGLIVDRGGQELRLSFQSLTTQFPEGQFFQTTHNRSNAVSPSAAVSNYFVDRFKAIYAAFDKERRWWRSSIPLRYAAMAAIQCEGDAIRVARGIRTVNKGLKEGSKWHWSVSPLVQFPVGAILYQKGDTATQFLRELVRVRKLFRNEKLHRAFTFELLAVLILRLQAGDKLIDQHTIHRFKAIYDEMKRHHKWLTGPDDFPACAILTGQSGTPRAIGEDIEAIYEELTHQGFARSNPLQTMANIMYLAPGSPREVAARARAFKDHFKEHKVRITQLDWDELAMLSILEKRPATVVKRVVAIREHLAKIRPRIEKPTTFGLAVGIAFLEFAAVTQRDESVSHTKVLMDVQSILAAQQAVLAAAGAAAAASAAT